MHHQYIQHLSDYISDISKTSSEKSQNDDSDFSLGESKKKSRKNNGQEDKLAKLPKRVTRSRALKEDVELIQLSMTSTRKRAIKKEDIKVDSSKNLNLSSATLTNIKI